MDMSLDRGKIKLIYWYENGEIKRINEAEYEEFEKLEKQAESVTVDEEGDIYGYDTVTVYVVGGKNSTTIYVEKVWRPRPPYRWSERRIYKIVL
jgi:hypothetical protein